MRTPTAATALNVVPAAAAEPLSTTPVTRRAATPMIAPGQQCSPADAHEAAARRDHGLAVFARPLNWLDAARTPDGAELPETSSGPSWNGPAPTRRSSAGPSC